MDITVADLLELEPHLALAAQSPGASAAMASIATREISWIVAARATPPHLPSLRGGEVVLIPARVTTVLGAQLPALVREANSRGASAVLFTRDGFANVDVRPTREALPILRWTGDESPDLETTINRRLTECRGDLYRIGSELERRLTDLAAIGGGLEALVRVVAEATGLVLTVEAASGRILATSPGASTTHVIAGSGITGAVVDRQLPHGETLWVGPLQPPDTITARFFADRIAHAAVAAMQRDDASRPRGENRITAVAALLSPAHATVTGQRAQGLALALDPDGQFVVVASHGVSEGALSRALEPLGTVLPAGEDDRGRMAVIALASRLETASLVSRINEVKRQWQAARPSADVTLALSAPVSGVASLPAAAAEARFLAKLQTQSPTLARVASFDSSEDVSAWQLLYPLREMPVLRRFVVEAIGPLLHRDQRGDLKATLHVFLQCGGSHAAASARLDIHRNTLAYRLRRISELLERDVTNPEIWLTLQLALRGSEMLDIVEEHGRFVADD